MTQPSNVEQPRYVLVGVVTGGIGECGNPRFPAVYVRIEDREVFDFVQSTIDLEAKVKENLFSNPNTILDPDNIAHTTA
jgi:secreted trypsin-like serine protease